MMIPQTRAILFIHKISGIQYGFIASAYHTAIEWLAMDYRSNYLTFPNWTIAQGRRIV
jgi:hypothetical protein